MAKDEEKLIDQLSLNEMKITRLKSTRKLLYAQFLAVSQQKDMEVNKATQVQLEFQIKEIERQISEIDTGITELTLGSNQAMNENLLRIIIVAMNHTQADELCNRSVINYDSVSRIQSECISTFLDSLQCFGGIQPNNYGNVPQEWKPNAFSEEPISEIVKRVFIHLNSRSQGKLSVKPDLMAANEFSELLDDRAQEGLSTENIEGVLIVDAISLFHPEILKVYSDLPINSLNMAILVIAPINYVNHNINHLVEQLVCEHRPTHRRFSSIDPLFEFSVGDLRSFNRWLFRFLQDEIKIMNNPQPSLVNTINMTRRQPTSSGEGKTSRLIFGVG